MALAFVAALAVINCKAPACVKYPISDGCDDSNPCTNDRMGPFGCLPPEKITQPLVDSPDDRFADPPPERHAKKHEQGCTQPDNPCMRAACRDGACVIYPATDQATCDGPDPGSCKENRCSNGACAPKPLSGGTCDDGDACTQNDTCRAGVCAGDAVQCTTSNPCAQARCDHQQGCVEVANPNPLPGGECDNDPCTVGDHCDGTTCVPGSPRDQNPATACKPTRVDECISGAHCEPGVGCQDDYQPDDHGCPPPDNCTVGTKCDGQGNCSGGQVCPISDQDPDRECISEKDCVNGECQVVPVNDGAPCSAPPGGCASSYACKGGHCAAAEGSNPVDALCPNAGQPSGQQCFMFGCVAGTKTCGTVPDPAKNGQTCTNALAACALPATCCTLGSCAIIGCVGTPDDSKCASTTGTCVCDPIYGCVAQRGVPLGCQ